ncbi:MAG: hypothetical protein RR879_08430, partial [Hydrogenoanaerobacterium sp.]
ACVKLLLPVSNPKANFSLAAQNAAQYSPHMLPLLIDRCNFDDALNAMKNSNFRFLLFTGLSPNAKKHLLRAAIQATFLTKGLTKY